MEQKNPQAPRLEDGAREGMKICKVCFKRYDPSVDWQRISHSHTASKGKEDLK